MRTREGPAYPAETPSVEISPIRELGYSDLSMRARAFMQWNAGRAIILTFGLTVNWILILESIRVDVGEGWSLVGFIHGSVRCYQRVHIRYRY